jgi:hypothetical protein
MEQICPGSTGCCRADTEYLQHRLFTDNEVDTGSKFAAVVIDTGGKFTAGFIGTGAPSVTNTGPKFATGVMMPLVNLPLLLLTSVSIKETISACFNLKLHMKKIIYMSM